MIYVTGKLTSHVQWHFIHTAFHVFALEILLSLSVSWKID